MYVNVLPYVNYTYTQISKYTSPSLSYVLMTIKIPFIIIII